MSQIDSELNGFSERLKRAIGEESVYSFAKRSGITESLLRKYLNGSSLPGLDKLVLISKASGSSIDWLVFGEKNEPLFQKGRYEGLLDEINRLSEEVSKLKLSLDNNPLPSDYSFRIFALGLTRIEMELSLLESGIKKAYQEHENILSSLRNEVKVMKTTLDEIRRYLNELN